MQAYSPTNPREFDFVNKPVCCTAQHSTALQSSDANNSCAAAYACLSQGSFALLEELTDSALSLSNRTPSSVGDTGRTAESTSKDALAGASALSL